MKISILTPSYNQGSFIERNIASVLKQNHDNVEHIIIDGGSTDDTVEILKRNSHLKWISEADSGQADALNKGLTMATGDIIGWINSDDYYRNNIFREVVKEFRDNNINWVIGNIFLDYNAFKFCQKIKSPTITYNRLIRNPDIIRQQAVFFRKSALFEVGAWDKQYHMTMDFDLWIRLSKKYPPKMADKYWAFFTIHEDQKSTPKNTFIQISNILHILQKENAPKSWIAKILAKKYYYLVKAIIKNCLLTLKLMDKKYNNIPLSILKDKKNLIHSNDFHKE